MDTGGEGGIERFRDQDRGPALAPADVAFFVSSRRRHTSWTGDWSSDVCSSDLGGTARLPAGGPARHLARSAGRTARRLVAAVAVPVRDWRSLWRLLHPDRGR